MMRGDHLVIMAPTEMGKSLFAVNLTYGFLVQGLKVLYCCNEEPSARTNLRVISRLAEMPKGELYDPTKWDEIRGILSKKGYGNFAITDLKPGTLSEIDELVMDFKADVVVVDQLRNLSMASESRTNQLEQAATGIRNIGKLRNVLPVSITQAGASAFGKTVLTRGDVDGSNVGIPGQADVLLGIGANEEMEVQGTRWISFPKNKNGDHTPFSVHFDTQLSKVTEI